MNIWKIASRWSDTGTHNSSILDIFLKNQVAFFHPDGGPDPSMIQPDDLIAISDGYKIVAVAKPASRPGRLIDLPGFHLSERDRERIDYCIDEVEGLKIHWLPNTLLDGDRSIDHPVRRKFCMIHQEAVRKKVIEVWDRADKSATRNEFRIDARTRTLHDLLTGPLTKLYLVPVFQRPYSWSFPEVERFLRDLITAFQKKEIMFAGTMQLSGRRVLSTRGDWFQEVIDGQQRLTTALLILKALELLTPGKCAIAGIVHNRDWLETKVSGGEQQKALDAVMHSEELPEPLEAGLNPYLDNLRQIHGALQEAASATTPDEDSDFAAAVRPLDLQAFARHFLEKIQFVVIETEAGLSKTIQIFNVINTTGLDLNGGDLFKVRMFEYLTDKHHHQNDCFHEISSLYESIERKNAVEGRIITSIQEILGIYQKFVAARNHLPIALVRANTETFYERMFDSLLGMKAWEGYKSTAAREHEGAPLLKLTDIRRLIELRHLADQEWHDPNGLSWRHRLALSLVEWSRYSSYWVLTILVDSCYSDEIESCPGLREDFAAALARVCVVYSVINAKQINEMHSFFAEMSARMFDQEDPKIGSRISLQDLTALFNQKISDKKELFESALAGDLSAYLTAKNLVCRLVEALHVGGSGSLHSIFRGGYDIEHICSFHDKDPTQRQSVWNDWTASGVSINGLGNLMLWQYDLNRSVKNDNFEAKKPIYAECGLSIAERISKHTGSKWMPYDAREKLERDSKLLTDYLF